MTIQRSEGRAVDALRQIRVQTGVLKYPTGSCEITAGDTRILISVKLEDVVPSFLYGQNSGWISATYNLLPGSCDQRVKRDKLQGRSMEIQRLVGRSLRAAVDLKKLPSQTLWVDCDILQADGGTRTLCVTGGLIALLDAFGAMRKQGFILDWPLKEYLAAISVGVVSGVVVTDLDFKEDVAAEVDMNIVMTESGKFVELQGTAEHNPFSDKQLSVMLDYASSAIQQLIALQKQSIKTL